MQGASESQHLDSAFERGRKSVRDGTVGNPYPVGSSLYDGFDQGVELETRLQIEAMGNHKSDLRIVA